MMFAITSAYKVLQNELNVIAVLQSLNLMAAS